MGLGRSRRDTYVRSWTAVDNYSHIQHNYHISDGVAIWVKIQVSNNVVVREIGHTDKPIIVDRSPPIPRLVYEEVSTVASTWRQFADPESDIKSYLVYIYRKPTGPSGRKVVLHTEKNIAPSVNSPDRHHFHLHHSDFVRVDVTAQQTVPRQTAR
ncbi:hypothetical protein LSAT2_009370 [Lamellibrachia satsuma]|nr:hypothetical protein LSAT2_009370 [Lamellibrachia satsuma]